MGLQIEKAGPNPELVLEATCGWYWAVDALDALDAVDAVDARRHGARGTPIGREGFSVLEVEERRARCR
ncbi:hypothetical protein [Rhodococcus jostii]|uniref:hypothetical protein n=1 Tax=Rhodococcus jostii TaxID=132919 RepID=UPI0036250DA8